MRSFLSPFLMIGIAFAVAGCQAKLTVSKTFTLPSDDDVSGTWEMPAQPSAQSIKVAVNVRSGPIVDVFVVNASDIGKEVANTPSERKKWEEKGYGFKRNVKSETVTVNVPANVKYKVHIMQVEEAMGKSEVEVKITN